MRDQIDSPPVPVAVGSPACARKSFETMEPKRLDKADSEKVDREQTIEEGIKVIIVDLAKFEEVLASFWTCLDLEIDDYVTEGCFQEQRHGPVQQQQQSHKPRSRSSDHVVREMPEWCHMPLSRVMSRQQPIVSLSSSLS